MGKIDCNKKKKREALLDSAFKLFTDKGIYKTSISDIVKDAGVAKGTFYLYFEDKYDIRNKLIAHKASEVFRLADDELKKKGIIELEEKIIFLVDNITNQFAADKALLGFVAKNLSWGIFKNVLIEAGPDDEIDFYDIYHSVFDADDNQYENPEVMVFMIIELVGAACYSSILYQEPVGIGELKPYLFCAIRQIMEAQRKKGE